MGKSLFFVTKCKQVESLDMGGALPHTDTLDSTSRLWAVSKSESLKRRASVCALSLEPLLKLTLPALETRSPTPEGRPAGLSP